MKLITHLAMWLAGREPVTIPDELRRMEQQRDKALSLVSSLYTQLKTTTNDRDHFADMYQEHLDAMQIRILVLAVDKEPALHVVTNDSWRTWYRLIDPSTDTFQIVHLTPGLEILCDEEGRRKKMELNLLLPAGAPQLDTSKFSFIVVPRETEDGRRLMEPNEPGIGFHEILGTCIIARRQGPKYVGLTDADIRNVRRCYGQTAKDRWRADHGF